jgi:hypothetical protein
MERQHPLPPVFRRTIPRNEDGSKASPGRSYRCSQAVTLIYGLDRLDREQQQGIERAGALTRFPSGAMSAHVTVEAIDVRVDRSASGRMGDLDDLRQVEFDAASLAPGTTWGRAGGTVDTVAAHVLPNLCQVLVEFCL